MYETIFVCRDSVECENRRVGAKTPPQTPLNTSSREFLLAPYTPADPSQVTHTVAIAFHFLDRDEVFACLALVEKATLVQAAANLSFSHVWSIAALSPAPGMPMQITSRVDIPCPTSPIISDITKLTGDELGSITYNIDEGVRA